MERISLRLAVQPTPLRKRARTTPTVDRKQGKHIARTVLAHTSLLDSSQAAYRLAQGMPRKSAWRAYLGALARVLSGNRRPLGIFIHDGNAKLPFVTFSTLPLFTCPGAGACARYCYSLGSWRYPGAFVRQLQNTLLIRHRRELVEEAFCDVPAGRTLRLYVDGDFEDVGQFGWWMSLLGRRPDIAAYGYSKSWDVIATYVKNGGKVPDNYTLNLSSGGRPQATSEQEMLSLPFVRGWFRAVEVDYLTGEPGNPGFARYDDPAYHALVRQAAPGAFSCPGKCGDCHKCGDRTFRREIAIGVH